MSIKVLVADDHDLIRQGFVHLIESDESFMVIDEANDGLKALNKIKESKPDVAVVDISMPKMTGLQVAKEIREAGLPVEFVVLTMFREEVYFNEAMNAGVKGYILKENTAHDLIKAIKLVSEGKTYISPLISHHLLAPNERKKALKEKKPSITLLTPAEKQILKLIAENKTSRAIGEELFISTRTVQNHRNNMCDKLKLKGANALLTFAVENKKAL